MSHSHLEKVTCGRPGLLCCTLKAPASHESSGKTHVGWASWSNVLAPGSRPCGSVILPVRVTGEDRVGLATEAGQLQTAWPVERSAPALTKSARWQMAPRFHLSCSPHAHLPLRCYAGRTLEPFTMIRRPQGQELLSLGMLGPLRPDSACGTPFIKTLRDVFATSGSPAL
jgi:hypothetical protein